MKKIQCSVGMLTFNSEQTLQRALESVKNFDEIIICDGGSSDETLKIAEEYGCKIITQDKEFKNLDNTIKDFSGVRNQCINSSKNSWFLFVDSDEYLSKEVIIEMQEVIYNLHQPYFVYSMLRKYVVDGQIIDCAATYPNYQIRFFHKKAVNGYIKVIHERPDINKGFEIGLLQNCEYVPLDSVRDLKSKWNSYIYIENERNKNETFAHWTRWVFVKNIKISILYLLRYIKILLFCKGKRMPFKYEILRHWYNLKMVWVTSKKFIGF